MQPLSPPYRWATSARISPVLLFLVTFLPSSLAVADVQSAVADARAAADAGDYPEAFSRAIAAVETYPESQWDAAILRAFVLEEVGHQWLPRLSAEQQSAAVALCDGAESPTATFLKGYALWRLGRPQEAMDLGDALIRTHPDSVGAQLAIFAMLFAQFPQLGDVEAAAAVLQIVRVAPNNPTASWGIGQVAWRCGARNYLAPARQLCSDVQSLKPDTLAAQLALQLDRLLETIEAGDFLQAFEVCIALPPEVRDEFNGLSKTFLMGIDWQHPAASAGRIATIEQHFGQLAENAADGDRKSLASAVLGRLSQRRGRQTEAAGHYQRIIDVDDPFWAWYGYQNLGAVVRRKDPTRAIAAFEGFIARRGHLYIIGDEPTYFLLGRLYVRQGLHAKAETLYRGLLERAAWGEATMPGMIDHFAAGLAGALFAQGKDQEAQDIIAPYFAKYRYGTPTEQLTLKERSDLAGLLFDMGRFDEARELTRVRAP